jgi:hypothetical protein
MNYTVNKTDTSTMSTDSIVSYEVNTFLCASSNHTERRKLEVWNELRKKFYQIGVSDRIIDSVALIPLIETAVDDGTITLDEKDKILLVMKKMRLLISGIDPKLNKIWIPFKGKTEFLIVWTVYLRDLSREMLPEAKIRLKGLVTESWNLMIQTIGGFLRVHNIDDRVRIAIESAFAYDLLALKGYVQLVKSNQKSGNSLTQ